MFKVNVKSQFFYTHLKWHLVIDLWRYTFISSIKWHLNHQACHPCNDFTYSFSFKHPCIWKQNLMYYWFCCYLFRFPHLSIVPFSHFLGPLKHKPNKEYNDNLIFFLLIHRPQLAAMSTGKCHSDLNGTQMVSEYRKTVTVSNGTLVCNIVKYVLKVKEK